MNLKFSLSLWRNLSIFPRRLPWMLPDSFDDIVSFSFVEKGGLPEGLKGCHM